MQITIPTNVNVNKTNNINKSNKSQTMKNNDELWMQITIPTNVDVNKNNNINNKTNKDDYSEDE